MSDYLSKPVDFHILTSMVAKWITAPAQPQQQLLATSCPASPAVEASVPSESERATPLGRPAAWQLARRSL